MGTALARPNTPLISLIDWKAQAFLNKAPSAVTLRKLYIPDTIEPSLDPENDLRMTFVISTERVDRDGDIVKVAGWGFEDWRKNPVVLFAHAGQEPPVAQGEYIAAVGGKVKSTALFTPRDVYEFGHTIYKLVLHKFLRATSVGYQPVDWAVDKARGGVNFAKQTLLEWSIVPIPSNPDSLAEAKSLGIELRTLKSWAIRTLDTLPDDVTNDDGVTKEMVEKALRVIDPSVSVSVPSLPPTEGAGGHAGEGTEIVKKLVEKIGRVLSRANEEKLRTAVNSLEEVLAAVETDSPIEKPGDIVMRMAGTPGVQKFLVNTEALGAALEKEVKHKRMLLTGK